MKQVFLYLAMLNVADGLLTFYGLQLSYMTEANPLMNSLYEINPSIFLTVKMTFSVLLIILGVFLEFKSHVVLGLAYMASVIYTLTLLLHSTWLLQV